MSVNAIAATHDKWKASSSMVIVVMIINGVVCKLYSAEFEDGLLTYTYVGSPAGAESAR